MSLAITGDPPCLNSEFSGHLPIGLPAQASDNFRSPKCISLLSDEIRNPQLISLNCDLVAMNPDLSADRRVRHLPQHGGLFLCPRMARPGAALNGRNS